MTSEENIELMSDQDDFPIVPERQVNDHIPPQFRYPEYQELDRHLTERFGLPFSYKRFNYS